MNIFLGYEKNFHILGFFLRFGFFLSIFGGFTVCTITSHFPIMSQRKLDAIILREGGNERGREREGELKDKELV